MKATLRVIFKQRIVTLDVEQWILSCGPSPVSVSHSVYVY